MGGGIVEAADEPALVQPPEALRGPTSADNMRSTNNTFSSPAHRVTRSRPCSAISGIVRLDAASRMIPGAGVDPRVSATRPAPCRPKRQPPLPARTSPVDRRWLCPRAGGSSKRLRHPSPTSLSLRRPSRDHSLPEYCTAARHPCSSCRICCQARPRTCQPGSPLFLMCPPMAAMAQTNSRIEGAAESFWELKCRMTCI